MPKAAKVCQKLWKYGKACQKLRNHGKVWLNLRKNEKKCQELRMYGKVCQKIRNKKKQRKCAKVGKSVCRYRPPSRHRLNQSGLLTSMLLYYDHMYKKKPCLLFIGLCIDNYTNSNILCISCTINQIDLWTVTVKSIVLFLIYFLEL